MLWFNVLNHHTSAVSTIWAHTFTAACWTHNRPCHKSINTNRQKTTNFNWTDSFNSSCFILIFLSYSSPSLPISHCKEPDLDPENSWSASHLISEIKRKKSRCSQKLHKVSGNKQMQSATAKNAIKAYFISILLNNLNRETFLKYEWKTSK